MPLASGEAVFAPFFDPVIAPSLPARLEPLASAGARASFFWCGLLVEWEGCVTGAEGAVLHFGAPVPGAPWSHALFHLMVPESLEIALERCDATGHWHAWGAAERGTATRLEIVRPLPAEGVAALRLRFRALAEGAASVTIAWFGVRQAALVEAVWAARPTWSPAWPGLLRPEAEWNYSGPKLGLLFGADDLPRLRARRNTPGWREVWAFLRDRAEQACAREPEQAIQDFVPWNDQRFTTARERDRGEWYLSTPILALVGLVDENPRYIRHALRQLMAVLHTRHWTCSPECRLTGSTWDTRCFLEEHHSTAVALTYDWLGHLLTPRAVDLLATGLWDKGIAVIERDLAKYENVHHINQAPWFNRGRLLATLVIESLWPRDGGHADRVRADLDADLGRYLLPDGGIDEGAGYLATTQEVTLVAYTAYARRRGQEVRAVLPPLFEKSSDYYATLASGTPGEFTTEGDASRRAIVSDALPILAGLYPDKPFGDWMEASLPRAGEFSYFQHYVGTGLYAFLLGPDRVPPRRAPADGRRLLPHTGLACDQRTRAGRTLRLQVIGCKARPSHSHRDKGAFVAELDGHQLFIDRGMIRYEDSRHQLLKRSEMHNVLTPLLPSDSAPDQAPPEVAVIPEVGGDGGRFSARLDLGNVWREWMTACRREIDSPHAGAWSVHDAGRLRVRGAVAFHLHALHPFIEEGGRLFAGPAEARVEVIAPWAVRRLQSINLLDSAYRPVHHLRLISAPVEEFALETRFIVA
jgi:hypothetical protein